MTDAHGNEVTERVASVEYTAKTPLPDGERDAFELSLQLPDKAGETLAFPTDPDLREGRDGLDRGPDGGQDAEELEHPAPAFEITEADEEGDDEAPQLGQRLSLGRLSPTTTATPAPRWASSAWSWAPSAWQQVAPRWCWYAAARDRTVLRVRRRGWLRLLAGGSRASRSRSHPPHRRRRTRASSRPTRPRGRSWPSHRGWLG